MAFVDNFDTDGGGVDIGEAAPMRAPRVPCAHVIVYKLVRPPILLNHIMGADFAGRIAKAFQRGFGALHSRIVQDDHGGLGTVGAERDALAVIGGFIAHRRNFLLKYLEYSIDTTISLGEGEHQP